MKYLQTIKKLFMIYYTNFPYNHYNYSNQHSNFGLIGISCELIYAQQTFWLANIGSFIFILNINSKDFFYYNMYMLIWSISLYLISFRKVTNIINKI
jgi:hypothetical protein